MAELYGKATGCCGGKGGSMHLGDPAVGMLPAIAIVGGREHRRHRASGSRSKLRGERPGRRLLLRRGRDQRGRLPRGPELRRGPHGCPIVFVCENNLYGASTPLRPRSRSSPDVADRAAAYGVPAQIVDGMDVLAVREATARGGRRGPRGRGADAARVQDVSLHRPQPQRRARLPRRARRRRSGRPRPARAARGALLRRGGAWPSSRPRSRPSSTTRSSSRAARPIPDPAGGVSTDVYA